MEQQIREAILTELSRQAGLQGSDLEVAHSGDRLTINGDVDLDALVFVIVGSLAGGP